MKIKDIDQKKYIKGKGFRREHMKGFKKKKDIKCDVKKRK